MEEEECSPGAQAAKYGSYVYTIPNPCFCSRNTGNHADSVAVITDFEDSRFDLEAFLKAKAAESK